jgi:hypothetical protein
VELEVKETGRSAMTLAVLAVIFLGGVTWAWGQVTEPFPEKIDPAPCTDTLFAAGEDIAPPQVMVSVLNAGGPNGLAGKTMSKLATHGFGQGDTGNAPADTGRVSAQVWASDPDDPAALLVASYLGKNVDIEDRPSGYPGITIVVGKGFKGVRKGHPTVTAEKDAYVCTPPLSTSPEDVN